METQKNRISDCRECPHFWWDFEAGRFYCSMAEQRQVEDLHLIPDWCPLAGILWTTASPQSQDASNY